MKQRLLLIFIALLPFTTCLAQEENTYNTVVDGISYHVDMDLKTARVIAPINFNGKKVEYEGNIVIPETIIPNYNAEFIVTSISPEAFKNDVTTGVDIPGTVDEIPDNCFKYCPNLRNVTIHYGVKRIGRYAFRGYQEINGKKIWGLKSLENIIFNSSVTSNTVGKGNCVIDEFAFYGCENLKNLQLKCVNSIGKYAFMGCESLTSVNIPTSVTYIGNCAFDIDNLKTIHISDLAAWCKIYFENFYTYSEYSLFLNGQEVKDLVIPESVTNLGDYTFAECNSLRTIVIPESVTNIGYATFFACKNLKSVTIPSSVTIIGDRAFTYCYSLTFLKIDNGVTRIGHGAFEGCDKLNNFDIPNSVTTIGDGAFSTCGSLTSLTIPSSVTTIGKESFCSYSLTKIVVDKENPKYDSRGNCNAIIETATNTLITGCRNTTIPDSITIIGCGAFRYCSDLTNISIPNSVTSIDSVAFWQCYHLKNITIPNSVTNIGVGAFYYCDSLRLISIPESVYNIGDLAFGECQSLTDIYALRTTPNEYNCGKYVFQRLPENCTLHVPSGCKEAYAACEPWSSFKNIIEDANVIDGLYYILDKDNMTAGITNSDNKYSGTIHIPSTITYDGSTYKMTSIEEKAFYEFKSLTRITIPESVTKIGDYSFYGCTNLKEIYCLNKIPPTLGNDALPDGLQTTSATPSLKEENGCILYVPIGCREAYSEAWNIPTSRIVEIEVTAIEKTPTTPNEAHPIGYYNLQGQRINKPQSGIVIVRYSDGTNRKILVK